VELYLHSRSTPSWRGAQFEHRDSFTFTSLNICNRHIRIFIECYFWTFKEARVKSGVAKSCIATCYGLDDRGSIPSTGTFFLSNCVETASGIHPTTYPVGTGVKRPEREVDCSAPSTSEVKN
jgi:hypothetical protein